MGIKKNERTLLSRMTVHLLVSRENV